MGVCYFATAAPYGQERGLRAAQPHNWVNLRDLVEKSFISDRINMLKSLSEKE